MELEKALGAFASALNIDAKELVTALKDGDDWLGEDEATEKITGLVKTRLKAAKDAQLKQDWVTVEKWVKSHGFEPGEDVKRVEMLNAFSDHIKEQKTAIDPTKPATLTKEELAALPDVKALLAERVTDALSKYEADTKKEVERLKSEYDGYKRKTESEKTQAVARQYLAKALEEGDVLLKPDGVEVSKEKRIEAVLRQIDFGKIILSDKGLPVEVDENGDPIEDEFGRPVDIAKKAVAIGKEIYGPRGIDPKKSGGDPKPVTGKGEAYKPTYTFAGEDDFNRQVSGQGNAAERAKMMQDYAHQQQKQAAG